MNRGDLLRHELDALERDGAGAANDLAQLFARDRHERHPWHIADLETRLRNLELVL